jgi:aldose 1-epimerase
VEAPKPAAIAKSAFGNVDGKEVSLYTLTNAKGLVMKVTNYGTIITEFHVPDKSGKLGDIVGGYENLDGYLKATPYFGATVGRVANRIKNGQFQLEGKTYKLAVNNPPNHLHGGKKGWDKVVWDAEPSDTPNGPSIKFTYVSKDGEEGYPGTVTAKVTYALTNDNEFKVDMEATTDKTTIVNMAHHTYWNLGGYDSGSIAEEELTLHADKYTPGDPVVPTGAVKPVKGTPFDFTTAKTVGKDLKAVVVTGNPIGYDHNFVVDGDPHALRPVARMKDPKSGRVLTLEADQPGVQFYAGIFLDGTITGKGHVYKQYDAFCLETQKFPNSINVPAWKNEVILKPGQTYKHVMIHRFSTE